MSQHRRLVFRVVFYSSVVPGRPFGSVACKAARPHWTVQCLDMIPLDLDVGLLTVLMRDHESEQVRLLEKQRQSLQESLGGQNKIFMERLKSAQMGLRSTSQPKVSKTFMVNDAFTVDDGHPQACRCPGDLVLPVPVGDDRLHSLSCVSPASSSETFSFDGLQALESKQMTLADTRVPLEEEGDVLGQQHPGLYYSVDASVHSTRGVSSLGVRSAAWCEIEMAVDGERDDDARTTVNHHSTFNAEALEDRERVRKDYSRAVLHAQTDGLWEKSGLALLVCVNSCDLRSESVDAVVRSRMFQIVSCTLIVVVVVMRRATQLVQTSTNFSMGSGFRQFSCRLTQLLCEGASSLLCGSLTFWVGVSLKTCGSRYVGVYRHSNIIVCNWWPEDRDRLNLFGWLVISFFFKC